MWHAKSTACSPRRRPLDKHESVNGSEYVNHHVAGMLNKLHIGQFTKSRPRHSNDNALVESKYGAIVRKWLGRAHIPAECAPAVNDFLRDHLCPFLNFHRPCLFPSEVEGPRGRKAGYEHRTPLTPGALIALEGARRENPGSGDAPVLPAPKNPAACMSSALAYGWWSRADRLAGLEPKPGRGWHSLRRKFASDLMDQPLKVLCQFGGWKTAKTVLRCYQRADEDQLRQALANRSVHA